MALFNEAYAAVPLGEDIIKVKLEIVINFPIKSLICLGVCDVFL